MIKRFLIITGFCLSVTAIAQNTTLINQEINKLKADSTLEHASWGITVISAKTGNIIASHNSEQSLIPASTLKALTTGAALDILGSNFKFLTRIAYSGEFDTKTGILNGDVYIIGGGDPSLGSKYFKGQGEILNQWVDTLKGKGIKKITGSIIADGSIFEYNPTPPQWIWADIGNYYGAGASGLSYKDNTFTIRFNSGSTGTTTQISSTDPVIANLELKNNVIAKGTFDSAYVYGTPFNYQYFCEGAIPPNKINFKVKAAMPDPALFCAQSFSEILQKSGIEINSKPTTIRLLEGKTSSVVKKELFVHQSPTLDKIVYWINQKSVNLYAEHLLKYLGYSQKGNGSNHSGIGVLKEYCANNSISTSGIYLYDGSGLARANVINTAAQAEIMYRLSQQKEFKTFYNSLPLAGKTGSLKYMFKGTIAEGNLRAKSGSFTGVRAYTGYVTSKNGELLCFSVIVNNYIGSARLIKKKLEGLLIAIAEIE